MQGCNGCNLYQVYELIKLNINPSSNAEAIDICRCTVIVVYGTTATWQARRFEIFDSARHFRIESHPSGY